MAEPAPNSHTHCQAAQISRTFQSLTISVSAPTLERKRKHYAYTYRYGQVKKISRSAKAKWLTTQCDKNIKSGDQKPFIKRGDTEKPYE